MQNTPIWQEYTPDLPFPWCFWLGVSGSLTEALVQAGGEPCHLAVQQEGYFAPWQDECQFLDLAVDDSSKHWVREITLSQATAGHLVYARSVFPELLIKDHSEFLVLGNNILGQLLFANPNIYRGDIEVAQLTQQHQLFQRLLNKNLVKSEQSLWARRSRFHIRNQQLLVCEVMLDAIASL